MYYGYINHGADLSVKFVRMQFNDLKITHYYGIMSLSR